MCVRERERGGREDERECARGSVRERRGGRMRESECMRESTRE